LIFFPLEKVLGSGLSLFSPIQPFGEEGSLPSGLDWVKGGNLRVIFLTWGEFRLFFGGFLGNFSGIFWGHSGCKYFWVFWGENLFWEKAFFLRTRVFTKKGVFYKVLLARPSER